MHFVKRILRPSSQFELILIKKTTSDIIIPLLFCSYQNVNIFSNLITFILPEWRISCIFSNVQLHHVLLLWFHLLFARKGKKSSSAISFISNEFCCCFTKDSVKHFKRVWDILSLYIYILHIVIVFLIKPNNLELILKHPASLLKNTVPRKSRVAPFYHRYKGVYEIEREVTFWNTSYSPVLIKLPHFSCSCRNEGQRLDAFQIYYLCDALNCNKAMSENNTFLNIKLNYYSFKIFPRFWLALISCSCRNEGQRLDAFEGGLALFCTISRSFRS